MKHIAYKLLGIFFISAAIGCETVYTEPVSSQGEIAVISSIGQEFTVAGIGTTVFQNTRASSADISAWGLDQFVAQEIVRLLSPNYDIRIESIDHSDFTTSEIEQEANFLTGNANYRLGDALQNHASKQGSKKPASYLVLINAARPGHARFRSAPELRGAGLYFEGFFGLKNTAVYIGADLALHDGETFEEERRVNFRVERGMVDGKSRESFFQFVSNDFAVGSFDELTEEQKSGIETELRKLISAGLPKTLTDMGFVLEEEASGILN